MSRLFSVAFLVCLGFAASDPCYPDWIQFEESCYGFGELQESWENAQEVCRSAGAKLAEIQTSEENEFLKSHARENGAHFWLGASDIFHEGVWRWMSSGVDLSESFSDWQHGEPDDSHEQDCLRLSAQYDYKWDDGTCSSASYFICETGLLEEPVVG